MSEVRGVSVSGDECQVSSTQSIEPSSDVDSVVWFE